MSQYQLILIPENQSDSKSYQVSRLTIYLSIFLVILFVGFSTSMTLGFLHYRQLAQKPTHAQPPESQEEKLLKAQLLTKVNLLEDTLERTQRLATKLESSVGVESHKLQLGVGPLSEKDDFGKYLEKLNTLHKTSAEDKTIASQPTGNLYQSLTARVEDLSEYSVALEGRLNEVYEQNHDKLTFWSSTPSILPVKGWVTSDFGMRISPFTGYPKFHEGIDIAAPYGTNIYASADGKVIFAGPKGGYGNAVIIDHGYGVSTLYAHASELLVAEGQRVKRGQSVALVGSTGASTGAHLHYEVHVDGVPTDPSKFSRF